jgi:hypothetical protein
MATFPVPGAGVASPDELILRAAVSAYLGRYRGQTRLHSESDLRVFLRWCTDQALDPLVAVRVDIERYVRWLQDVRCYQPSTVSSRSPPGTPTRAPRCATTAPAQSLSPSELHPRRLHGLRHIAPAHDSAAARSRQGADALRGVGGRVRRRAGSQHELHGKTTVRDGLHREYIESTGAILAGRNGFDSAIGDSRPYGVRGRGRSINRSSDRARYQQLVDALRNGIEASTNSQRCCRAKVQLMQRYDVSRPANGDPPAFCTPEKSSMCLESRRSITTSNRLVVTIVPAMDHVPQYRGVEPRSPVDHQTDLQGGPTTNPVPIATPCRTASR